MAKSKKEQTEQSVLDFLYVDAVRVRSFISQLGEIGVLDGVTETDALDASKATTFSGSIGGEPIIGSGVERTSERATSESQSRTYDVQHRLPVSLLNLLETQNLIQRKIVDAAIGDLVVCSGTLSIIDTSFHRELYSSAKMKELSVRRSEERLKKEGQTYDLESLHIELDMIRMIPPFVQALVDTGNVAVWLTLRPESLTTPPHEINMKHGVVLQGSWTLLGIKDSTPSLAPEILQDATRLKGRFENQSMIAEMIDVLTALRGYVGRPPSSYGVTPLLIYREANT
ncbi:MAG: hypothetical protein H6923_08060 [Alphaproteobacteria bacterium]|nr:hypothetical protein [Alphaproteobacteria bacterium]